MVNPFKTQEEALANVLAATNDERLKQQKAVVIFSGGQDSTTCLLWAKATFKEVEVISFFYGQQHSVELECAKKIAADLDVKHSIIDISFFNELVDSALTVKDGDVCSPHPRLQHLPASFVPNRNATFITLAHAYAQKVGAMAIITGVSAVDYSGYSDCSPQFINAIQTALNIGTWGADNLDAYADELIQIHTPIIYLDKGNTFLLAEKLGNLDVVTKDSHTCYFGNHENWHDWGYGCSTELEDGTFKECPACMLRRKGWDQYLEYTKAE